MYIDTDNYEQFRRSICESLKSQIEDLISWRKWRLRAPNIDASLSDDS